MQLAPLRQKAFAFISQRHLVNTLAFDKRAHPVVPMQLRALSSLHALRGFPPVASRLGVHVRIRPLAIAPSHFPQQPRSRKQSRPIVSTLATTSQRLHMYRVHNVPDRALSAPADDIKRQEQKNAVHFLGLPVGGIAGVFGSILGVGGGVLMVPMMTCKPLELEARQASATSLVAVVGTGLVSAILYGLYGQVDPVGAMVISSAAVLTAPAGAKATMRISNAALKKFMGVFLLCVAPSVFLRDMLMESLPTTTKTAAGSSPDSDTEKKSDLVAWLRQQPGLMALPPSQQVPYVAILLSAGSVAGFLSGLLGIGGGLIVTPIMALFSGMPQHVVVGTSMLAMVAPSSVSLYTHHRLGNVQWPVGRLLLLGSACGAAGGVQLAQMCEDKTMKRVFAAGMCVPLAPGLLWG